MHRPSSASTEPDGLAEDEHAREKADHSGELGHEPAAGSPGKRGPANGSGPEHAAGEESLLVRARRRVPAGVWYGLGALGFAVVIIIVQFILYQRQRIPRDARAIVERELRFNTLQPDERVLRSVPVFRRTAVDYFRQTQGVLTLTDRRLIYLGAPPRDITAPADQPPAFDQQEFRIDTLVAIKPSRTLLGFARALRVEGPDGDLKVGVPSDFWPRANILREAWKARHAKLRNIGVWAGRVREARSRLDAILAEYRSQPVYHVVRAGDALASIASWYETTPDSLRELNSIEGNRIKVGQRLLIRSGK